MIVHMVLFKMKPGTSQTAIDRVMKSVGGLRRKVPGITSFRWGRYSSPEGLNRSYTHGFCMTFRDAAARDTYLTHPAHEKVKAAGMKIVNGGVRGVLAFDFEA